MVIKFFFHLKMSIVNLVILEFTFSEFSNSNLDLYITMEQNIAELLILNFNFKNIDINFD